jgi:hypothetical protein
MLAFTSPADASDGTAAAPNLDPAPPAARPAHDSLTPPPGPVPAAVPQRSDDSSLYRTSQLFFAAAEPPPSFDGGATSPVPPPRAGLDDELVRALMTLRRTPPPDVASSPPAAVPTAPAAAAGAEPVASMTDATSPMALLAPAVPRGKVRPLDPRVPIATDDTDAYTTQHAYYIARENLGIVGPGGTLENSWYNVSADAGVQVNDFPGTMGDLLRSGPVNGPVPGLGGFSTITTDQGGMVMLGADGSFNYLPPVGFTGVDHFQYVDTEFTQGGAQLGTSNVANVNLHVQPQNPTALATGPMGTPLALDTFHPWPKFHNDTSNTGDATGFPPRGTATFILSSPNVGFPVQGSPVLGITQGTASAFVDDD